MWGLWLIAMNIQLELWILQVNEIIHALFDVAEINVREMLACLSY